MQAFTLTVYQLGERHLARFDHRGAAIGIDSGLLRIYWTTLKLVRYSLLTIGRMMAIGFHDAVFRDGRDARSGVRRTGWLYPFFGTDAGLARRSVDGYDTFLSNVSLLAVLQKIYRTQCGLMSDIDGGANSSGGGGIKMIDAQSIVVASTAPRWYESLREILRYVFIQAWYSRRWSEFWSHLIQEYVFTWDGRARGQYPRAGSRR